MARKIGLYNSYCDINKYQFKGFYFFYKNKITKSKQLSRYIINDLTA